MLVEIVGLRLVISVPPLAESYHLTVPALAVAENVTLPETQTEVGDTDAELTVGSAFTVALTAVLAAETHPLFVASA